MVCNQQPLRQFCRHGLAVATLLILLCGQASAQTVFRWTDENGQVHYSQSIPPEHVHRGYERIGPGGIVLERVVRALTAEEIAEREALAAERARQAEEQARQQEQDRRILARFPNEDAITAAFNQRQANLSRQRVTLNSNLVNEASRFEQRIQRAAQLNRDGSPVPPELDQNIRNSRREIRRLREALEELDQREAAQREEMEADLEAFRAARARQQP